MIALSSDCLLVTTSNGEAIPYSAEMLSIELAGDSAKIFEEEFVRHAADAVFHYFRHELGVQKVSLVDFAAALEKVLRGFATSAKTAEAKTAKMIVESDLCQLARESGEGRELVFFPLLRAQLRDQLRHTPRVMRFRGLRGCVKHLIGAQRWSERCQTLQGQIVAYLRECLTAEVQPAELALVVE